MSRKRQAKAKEVKQADDLRKAFTMNRCFDAYTRSKIFTDSISERTQASYLRCYRLHIEPTLGKVPVSDVKPRTVYNLLSELTNSSNNVSITVLKRIQKIALQMGEIETPFVIDSDRFATGISTRVIDDLPDFLKFLDMAGYRSLKNALHMQLLTGSRGAEIYGLKWSDVSDVLSIDWTRVKNRRVSKQQFHPLVVPVLPAMQAILDEQVGYSDTCVFPKLGKDEPITTSGVHWYLTRKHDFTFSSHYVRRSVASNLRKLEGVTVDDISIILDHSVQGSDANYIHGQAVDKKRRILSTWHSYLQSLSTPEITTIKSVHEV